MKTSLLSLLLCLALAGIAHAVGNPVNIGYGLANQCRVATQAGGTGALPPPAWKCLSYIDGWLEGLDGALVTDDNGVLQTVAVGDGVTAIQAASAYVQYMEKHAEEDHNPRQLALVARYARRGVGQDKAERVWRYESGIGCSCSTFERDGEFHTSWC